MSKERKPKTTRPEPDEAREPVRAIETSEEIVNSIGMKLVLIPAGEFLMGSPVRQRGTSKDEKPQHVVRITRPFCLGMTEVTRGEFCRFVGDTGYQTEAEKEGGHKTWQDPGFEQTDEHPVVNVSWNDAVAFAEWLSQKEGPTYRLPTEAEWEYACRAGTTTRYSFGDDQVQLGEYAWFDDNSGDRTHPVGQKKANPWGLFDMHGNVWEWCWDWYADDYYKRSPTDDPRGPDEACTRVFRGGSWNLGPGDVRTAFRMAYLPEHRFNGLGFRVARVQSVR